MYQAYMIGIFFGFIGGMSTTYLVNHFSKYKPDYVIFFHYKRWYIKQLRYGLFYTVVRNDLLRPNYPLCFMSRKEAEDYLASIK